jgi:hypothetical protein
MNYIEFQDCCGVAIIYGWGAESFGRMAARGMVTAERGLRDCLIEAVIDQKGACVAVLTEVQYTNLEPLLKKFRFTGGRAFSNPVTRRTLKVFTCILTPKVHKLLGEELKERIKEDERTSRQLF